MNVLFPFLITFVLGFIGCSSTIEIDRLPSQSTLSDKSDLEEKLSLIKGKLPLLEPQWLRYMAELELTKENFQDAQKYAEKLLGIQSNPSIQKVARQIVIASKLADSIDIKSLRQIAKQSLDLDLSIENIKSLVFNNPFLKENAKANIQAQWLDEFISKIEHLRPIKLAQERKSSLIHVLLRRRFHV